MYTALLRREMLVDGRFLKARGISSSLLFRLGLWNAVGLLT